MNTWEWNWITKGTIIVYRASSESFSKYRSTWKSFHNNPGKRPKVLNSYAVLNSYNVRHPGLEVEIAIGSFLFFGALSCSCHRHRQSQGRDAIKGFQHQLPKPGPLFLVFVLLFFFLLIYFPILKTLLHLVEKEHMPAKRKNLGSIWQIVISLRNEEVGKNGGSSHKASRPRILQWTLSRIKVTEWHREICCSFQTSCMSGLAVTAAHLTGLMPEIIWTGFTFLLSFQLNI